MFLNLVEVCYFYLILNNFKKKLILIINIKVFVFFNVSVLILKFGYTFFLRFYFMKLMIFIIGYLSNKKNKYLA